MLSLNKIINNNLLFYFKKASKIVPHLKIMHDKDFGVKIVRNVHDFCRDFVPWLQHRFFEASKFVNSDEGLPCVNTIEKIYLGLLVTVFALAIISLFRLSHFRTELRKVFDPRTGSLLKLGY